MSILDEDKRNWLLGQIVSLSELLKDGRYDEIDLSVIEKEAADLASNFGEVINSLEEVGYKLGGDKEDVQQISHHLQHISRTTEEGVMQVMDHSESIVSDATAISDNLSSLREKVGDNPEIQQELEAMDAKLGSMQNSAFTIMTSLEFEDINRQKLEKILKKLNQLYDNLIKVLLLLKLKESIEKKDSTFIRDIRQISDPNEDNSSKQGMIDELLKEFGL